MIGNFYAHVGLISQTQSYAHVGGHYAHVGVLNPISHEQKSRRAPGSEILLLPRKQCAEHVPTHVLKHMPGRHVHGTVFLASA